MYVRVWDLTAKVCAYFIIAYLDFWDIFHKAVFLIVISIAAFILKVIASIWFSIFSAYISFGIMFPVTNISDMFIFSILLLSFRTPVR